MDFGQVVERAIRVIESIEPDKPSKTVGGAAAGRPNLNRTIVDIATIGWPTQMAVPNGLQ